ncbi:MAG: ABC transporter permease [Oligoflexia bacterium]|nr:ABC transporter permease [Oligoflexia bacterium]
MQVYFTGVQALPLIAVLALLVGGLVIIQSISQLSKIGAGETLGNLMVVIVIRELSPLVTAFVITARSGTAIASEVGNMKVNGEVDALESMGISQIQYMVAPRFFGGVIATIALAFYFNVVAILGGFVGASFFLDVFSVDFYFSSIVDALTIGDFSAFFIKNLVGGAMIFLISVTHGLRVRGASTEVPVAAIKAVVHSLIFFVSFNVMVTLFVYTWGGGT